MKPAHAMVEPVDGLDLYYNESIEPPIRLPAGATKANPLGDHLAMGAFAVVCIGAALWVFGAPVWLYGLVFTLGAGLVLGAVQLKMGGAGMSAVQVRDHVVKCLAEFLALKYERAPDSANLDALFLDAGRLDLRSISLRQDLLSGEAEGIPFWSVQIIGAVVPARSSALWLGLPVDRLSDRYNVDGLLMRFDLPEDTGTHLTASSDRRLAHRDKPDSLIAPLAPIDTGDAPFDEEFRLLEGADGEPGEVLAPDLRALLVRLNRDLGPLTFRIDGDRAWLNIWSIGDCYEMITFGAGLRPETHRIARVMGAVREVAEVLGRSAGDTNA